LGTYFVSRLFLPNWNIRGITPAIAVAGFWTIWTIVLVFTPHLMIFQLTVVWGPLLLLRHIERQGKTIRSNDEDLDELRNRIEELSEILSSSDIDAAEQAALSDSLHSANLEEISLVRGYQHRRALRQAISNAESSIYICSGWLGTRVINSEFCDLIRRRLQDGVDIQIGYGWESITGSTRKRASETRSEEALNEIVLSHQGPGRLVLHKFPNHSKVILVDDNYYLIGSHNWLSNYSFKNEEVSLRISDPKAVRDFRQYLTRVFQSAKASQMKQPT